MSQALKLVAPARAKGKAEPSHMVAALTEAMSTYMPGAAALARPVRAAATLPAPTAEVTAAAKAPGRARARRRHQGGRRRGGRQVEALGGGGGAQAGEEAAGQAA